MLAGVALGVAFVRNRRFWAWGVLPVLAALPALLLAGDAYLVFGLGFIVIAVGALLARALLCDEREAPAVQVAAG